MRLEIQPVTISEAKAFVAQHHRHHKAPVSGLFAVAVGDGSKVRGVAVVGRPSARMLQDGWTAEVTRVATDGVCADGARPHAAHHPPAAAEA